MAVWRLNKDANSQLNKHPIRIRYGRSSLTILVQDVVKLIFFKVCCIKMWQLLVCSRSAFCALFCFVSATSFWGNVCFFGRITEHSFRVLFLFEPAQTPQTIPRCVIRRWNNPLFCLFVNWINLRTNTSYENSW